MVKCCRNHQGRHAQHHPSVGPLLPVQAWPAPQVFWHSPSMCPVLPTYHQHSQYNAGEPQLLRQDPSMPQCSQYNTSIIYSQIKILIGSPVFPVRSQCFQYGASLRRSSPHVARSVFPVFPVCLPVRPCGSGSSSSADPSTAPKAPSAPSAGPKVARALPVQISVRSQCSQSSPINIFSSAQPSAASPQTPRTDPRNSVTILPSPLLLGGTGGHRIRPPPVNSMRCGGVTKASQSEGRVGSSPMAWHL